MSQVEQHKVAIVDDDNAARHFFGSCRRSWVIPSRHSLQQPSFAGRCERLSASFSDYHMPHMTGLQLVEICVLRLLNPHFAGHGSPSPAIVARATEAWH